MATTEEDLLRQLAELEAGAPPGPEPVPVPEEQQEQQLGLRSDIAAEGKAQELEDIAAMEPTPIESVDPYAEVEKRYETQRMFVDPYAQLAPGYEPPPPTEFPSPFPMERGTSRASLQLPELVETGTGAFLPPDLPALAKAGITAAVMTTTDPNEIAQIFTQTYTDENTGLETQVFPDVGMTTAPDGVLILTNRKTGKSALINRPGISGMDVLQLLGLGMTFTPAGRVSAIASAPARTLAQKAATETAKKLALKTARRRGAGAMMAGSGVTETALQAGQVAAGGSFDPADIALSTVAGALPDYALDPLVRAGTKLPAMLPVVGKKIEDISSASFAYARVNISFILLGLKRKVCSFFPQNRRKIIRSTKLSMTSLPYSPSMSMPNLSAISVKASARWALCVTRAPPVPMTGIRSVILKKIFIAGVKRSINASEV